MQKFPAIIPLETARNAPLPPGRRSPEMMRHGSLEVRFYAPRGSDPQTPHDRDEVYVVVNGTGWFPRGGERHRFKPGAFLFVPAQVEPRFEGFSNHLELS